MGLVSTATPAPGHLWFPASPDAAGPYAWNLVAERLQVRWSNTSGYELQWPPDFERPFFFANTEPSEGFRDFAGAAAVSERRSAESGVLVQGQGPRPFGLEFESPDMRFGEFAPATWTVGPQAESSASAGEVEAQRSFTPSADLLHASLDGGRILARGDLHLVVWDAAVDVQSRTGEERFESGRQEQAAATASAAQPVKRVAYQILELRAENATFSASTADRARIAAASFSLVVAGRASFHSARGLVSHGETEEAVADEPVTVMGQSAVEVMPGDNSRGKFDSRLRVQDGRLAIEGRREFIQAAAAAPAAPIALSWWWLLLVPAVAVPAFLVSRRVQAPEIEAIEKAVLEGRMRKGHRLASRLVRKRPRDPNVVFLYGTTLLARETPSRLLQVLGPLASKLSKRERRGVAFIMAIAARAAGEAETLGQWAHEAAVDPIFRERLRHDGIWDDAARNASTSRQTGYV